MTAVSEEVIATEDSTVVRENRSLRWLALAILACSLAVSLYVRVRLLDFPLERDEGEYAYIGQLILHGIPPYKLAYTMKMPGTHLAYASIMATFGQTARGIHIGLLLVHLTSLALLFLLTRRFFGMCGAAIATSAYALMTLSPAFLGLAAHATHFVVLAELGALWLFLCAIDHPHWLRYTASGFLFGVAFLMKQHAVFFGLFGGLYLVWIGFMDVLRRGYFQQGEWRSPLRTLAGRVGTFSLGCLLPLLAICVWLKATGVFTRFWFWTFTYAHEYTQEASIDEGLENLKSYAIDVFRTAPGLWTVAAVGLILLCCVRWQRERRTFLLGFVVFSFLAVCPGLYFRAPYGIVLLPAVSLLIGLAVSWCISLYPTTGPAPWLRYLPLLLAGIACAQSLYVDRAVLFRLSPTAASRVTYGEWPFPESVEIASYIAERTQPEERIAVVGSEPQIYFYAHRLSSTGYIYMYPLTEPISLARTMQADLIHEIEQNPPAYLVLVGIPGSWGSSPSSLLMFDWIRPYLSQNMRPVGLLQIIGRTTGITETVWGSQAAVTPVHSPYFIWIFERKNRT